MNRLLLLPILALSLPAVAAAQAGYTIESPTSSNNPPGVASLSGTTDGANFYIFGGRYGSPTVFSPHLSNELWSFDGAAWSNLTGTGGPSAREFFGISYDLSRGKLVLFGGKDLTSTSLGETWEWDVTNGWVQHAPAIAPNARHWNAMVYDPNTQRCVMFGGYDGSTFYDDTWAWDGAAWTQFTPANKPSPRGRHGMAYDVHRGVAVLFGGTSSNPRPNAETWEWSGSNWAQITTATVPYNVGCVSPGMSYDWLRRRVVMAAGYDNVAPNIYEDNTYEYDGTDWTDRGTFPNFEARGGPAMAFVPGQGKSLLFGGFNNTGPFTSNAAFPNIDNRTFSYQTDKVASFAENPSFPGCAGSAGLPQLTVASMPWAGTSMDTSFGPVPGTGMSVLFFGIFPGNLPLGVIGFPGCTSHTSLTFDIPTVVTGGTATVALPIPNLPAIYGAPFYLQGLSYDGTLSLTGRGDGVIGAY